MVSINCPFCSIPAEEVVLSNEYCIAKWDRYPVGEGHLLIIPKRHVSNYFDATQSEVAAFWQLINEAKQLVDREFSPDGYNIGINVGEAAGQTVFHLHIHLIPRYKGDIEDPTGGVRGVIPEKQKY